MPSTFLFSSFQKENFIAIIGFDDKMNSEEKIALMKEGLHLYNHDRDVFHQDHIRNMERLIKNTTLNEIKELARKQIEYILSRIICIICKKEHIFGEKEKICYECKEMIKTKNRKTYGWLFYHFLNLEKKYGKIVIKGDTDESRIATSKYGLQRIYVNTYDNKVTFEFYFGRSFCHRPLVWIPLNKIKENKEVILNLINEANHHKYIDLPDTFEKKSASLKTQDLYQII